MVQYCVASWAMVRNGMGGRGVAVAVWVRRCEARLGAAWRGRQSERSDIMVYQWKSGSRIGGISAQVAGEVCEQLDSAGCLSAQRLVDVSRPKEAALHTAFEWDDSIAGEEWRKHQARHIINSIIVVQKKEDEPVPVRAFFKIEQSEGTYESVHTILRCATKREMLMQDALRELDSFKRKYSVLKELSGVFAAIEDAKNFMPSTEE